MILNIILAIVVLDFLFEQFLEYLNFKSQKKEIPEEVSSFYDRDKFFKSLEYQKANNRFGFLTSSISFLGSFSMLYFGGFGILDNWLRPLFTSEIQLGLAYFFVLFVASDILTLPFQWYKTFVIEARFDFNNTTYKTFITDKLKGYILVIIIGGLLGFLLFWLILTIGASFWLYFLLVSVVFILFIQLFYSSLILPLFNKLSPLEEGELKDAITKYSSSAGFSLSNIYVIDGSKRSKKSNAFFMGLGKKKKIVLYDTLIENHSIEELVAILAHEMGHYKKKHILSGMFFSILQIAFTLYILSLMVYNEQLSISLGAGQLAIHLNLIAFSILYSPVSKITGILMNIWSRKNEFEADHFAGQTYDKVALSTALKKLSVDNLSNLYPHKAYVFVNYSHPPLLERLKELNK